ncbi:amidohydrolase [uncultured Dokdonia sp.]|uniref:amidohydrolase n=1 Tax=uncultured Dokdonia sp. TaxID=575653 RepID=UPI0030EEC04D|tara:strand:+ start:150207 stop:150986 length:780 start_codon:yes stop_codon:yes gene_type:complete
MKSETLQVSLIQTSLFWEDANRNRAHQETLIAKIPRDSDLIVLPEMFTTGFSMSPQSLAETMDGETVKWMKQQALKSQAAICGSLIISEGGLYYNRFLFITPEGEITSYNKRHTFNMAGEGEQYKAGNEQVLIHYKGWKIFPQICYDLRFPVYARNTYDYDLIIYVANWPKTRIAAWDTLLKARAIENMSYCVGVNRVGVDGNNLEYIGHSAVYDVLGGEMVTAHTQEGVVTTTLTKAHVNDTRSKLPFLQDKDRFTLE